jgi:hypothetical protein
MVKNAAVVLFGLLCAIPAMAQEDYPKVQTSLGYANLGFIDFGSPTGANSRHSGFANETGFNLTRNLGINNYMGIYGLGGGITMISDLFGGKAMYRATRVVPYGVAGIGFGYLTSSNSYYSYGSAFATRFGGGVDVPFKESLAWKFEISRMSFHFGSWISGTNFQTGIVFTILQ